MLAISALGKHSATHARLHHEYHGTKLCVDGISRAELSAKRIAQVPLCRRQGPALLYPRQPPNLVANLDLTTPLAGCGVDAPTTISVLSVMTCNRQRSMSIIEQGRIAEAISGCQVAVLLRTRRAVLGFVRSLGVISSAHMSLKRLVYAVVRLST